MVRFRNLAIEVGHHKAIATLTNIEESRSVVWKGKSYSSVPNIAGFYEILRSKETKLPIGFEFHLGSSIYEDTLRSLFGFQKLPPFEGLQDAWQFRFVDTDGYIDWEQIATNNPFLSPDGDALLIVQLWHLPDSEYQALAFFCTDKAT
jgi:hypothetical protein